MNKTLTIILMVMAGVAWGETNKIYVVDNLPMTLPDDATVLMTDTNGPCKITSFPDPEQIRKLAKSGKICEVMGFHCWGEIKKVWVAEPHDPSCVPWEYELCDQRKCKLCGKVETKTVEWK